MPAIQDLTASRNATWAPTLVYPYPGPQLPAIAHIAMQLRLYPGAPHDPLLTLNPIDYVDQLQSGTAGDPDEQRLLILSPSIAPGDPAAPAAGTLASLPVSAEAGQADTFAFDIRITYADAASELLSSGAFIVSPGVTTV